MRWFWGFIGILLAGAWGGCNPFAPALEDMDVWSALAGDPRTVDGFFKRFQYAYEVRDISLYETLLDSSFVFIYYDFNAQIERQWGFAQELRVTRRLFDESSLIRLQWNQRIAQDVIPEQTKARVVRSFSLTVALQNGEVFRGDGNVNFLLARPDTLSPWRLLRWRDESTF